MNRLPSSSDRITPHIPAHLRAKNQSIKIQGTISPIKNDPPPPPSELSSPNWKKRFIAIISRKWTTIYQTIRNFWLWLRGIQLSTPKQYDPQKELLLTCLPFSKTDKNLEKPIDNRTRPSSSISSNDSDLYISVDIHPAINNIEVLIEEPTPPIAKRIQYKQNSTDKKIKELRIFLKDLTFNEGEAIEYDFLNEMPVSLSISSDKYLILSIKCTQILESLLQEEKKNVDSYHEGESLLQKITLSHKENHLCKRELIFLLTQLHNLSLCKPYCHLLEDSISPMIPSEKNNFQKNLNQEIKLKKKWIIKQTTQQKSNYTKMANVIMKETVESFLEASMPPSIFSNKIKKERYKLEKLFLNEKKNLMKIFIPNIKMDHKKNTSILEIFELIKNDKNKVMLFIKKYENICSVLHAHIRRTGLSAPEMHDMLIKNSLSIIEKSELLAAILCTLKKNKNRIKDDQMFFLLLSEYENISLDSPQDLILSSDHFINKKIVMQIVELSLKINIDFSPSTLEQLNIKNDFTEVIKNDHLKWLSGYPKLPQNPSEKKIIDSICWTQNKTYTCLHQQDVKIASSLKNTILSTQSLAFFISHLEAVHHVIKDCPAASLMKVLSLETKDHLNISSIQSDIILSTLCYNFINSESDVTLSIAQLNKYLFMLHDNNMISDPLKKECQAAMHALFCQPEGSHYVIPSLLYKIDSNANYEKNIKFTLLLLGSSAPIYRSSDQEHNPELLRIVSELSLKIMAVEIRMSADCLPYCNSKLEKNLHWSNHHLSLNLDTLRSSVNPQTYYNQLDEIMQHHEQLIVSLVNTLDKKYSEINLPYLLISHPLLSPAIKALLKKSFHLV